MKNTARSSLNQKVANHQEERYNERQKALKTLEIAKEINKDKPVKYLTTK